MPYAVKIADQPKGEIFKLSGKWRWARPGNMGIETYPRGRRLIDVRDHIARLNNVRLGDVRLIRQHHIT